MTKKNENPTAQGNKKVGYKNPPKERQFGAVNGNPRNPSGWKKEDTLRYKWEKMLKMDREELAAVLENPKASRVEAITAEV